MQNEKCGLFLLSDTCAKIENNTIEENRQCGIDIRDPSLPDLKRNKIEKNVFQIKVEQKARKRVEQYRADNTIVGPSDIP